MNPSNMSSSHIRVSDNTELPTTLFSDSLSYRQGQCIRSTWPFSDPKLLSFGSSHCHCEGGDDRVWDFPSRSVANEIWTVKAVVLSHDLEVCMAISTFSIPTKRLRESFQARQTNTEVQNVSHLINSSCSPLQT